VRVEEFTDITYRVDRGDSARADVEPADVNGELATPTPPVAAVAVITINRPERYNAFRGRTVDELIAAFRAAWSDRSVAAVVLTGAGDKAFCAGGDQKQRAETGDYGPTEHGTFEIERLHRVIREIPKPVIAAVNGIAIGGGHVLHVLCDLTVAAAHATFGQAGPRVGSFDAGFGAVYLARVVGEKRARQIWFLLETFDAATAERWGLVNAVVPLSELLPTALSWGRRIGGYSPTALKYLKHSFNADTEHVAGLSTLAYDTLEMFTPTDEAREGYTAFVEKRRPDFGPYR
jgi:naphthoate synthase